ncbi:MAG TPA: hypothetical protein VFK70_12515 [Vicinamibacteria bacterium]|nr:hypothetical protein [Vicinamibacteria bacterium]
MIAVLACALMLKGLAAPGVTLHLSVDQDGGLSAFQVRLVVREVGRIWKDAGVDVTSGPFAAGARPGQASVSLRILRVGPSGQRPDQRVLAWVIPAATGRSAPDLFVCLPAMTETVMGAEAMGGWTVSKLTLDLQVRLLARAIGRVAAHELGHYLLQSARHESRGLMRPTYSPDELVGESLEPFQVPDAQRSELRTGIEAWARLQAIH